jgi:hypothetical protein
MSERFVEAFLVAPSKLTALLGTPAVGFPMIEKALGKKQIFEDLLMTVGDGDEDDGRTEVESGLAQLAAGKNPTIAYSERLTQLVLHAHAELLKPAMMECNFMPADEDGFWRPAFKALGMKTIAKQWAKPTLVFPNKKALKTGWGWPVMTLVEPASLALWKAELATPWRKKLKTLPNTTFDPEAEDGEEDVYLSRAEVEAGIATVEKWVTAASKPSVSKRKAVGKTGNALVLILDGDQ